MDYNYNFGLPLWTKDLNGKVTYFDYDDLGQLTKVALPGDSLASPSIEYSYYYPGSSNQYTWLTNYPRLVVVTKSKIDDTRKLETRQFYDGLGQLIQTQTANTNIQNWAEATARDGSSNRGKTTTVDVVTSVKYNSLGLKDKETIPYSVVAYTELNHPYVPFFKQTYSSYQYDSLGRVKSVTDPENRVTLTSYLGWTARLTDGENHATETTNDAYGRTKETRLYGNDGNLYKKTENSYDTLGNLISTSFVGYTPTVKTFINNNTYDSYNRLILQEDADLGDTRFGYDNNGNTLWVLSLIHISEPTRPY